MATEERGTAPLDASEEEYAHYLALQGRGDPVERSPTGRPKAPRLDPDVDEFLNEPEPDHDWCLPGLLERGDRLILTGPEGGGKSTFLRQMGVQAAAGIHPFTGEPMAPVPTLLIDLENSRRHLRRQLRPLRLVAGAELKPGLLRIRSEPSGIDLTNPLWAEWLDLRLAADGPELVLLGPLYKLSGGDPTEEKPARQVALFLDQMRAKFGFALVLEAHQPYAQRGQRPERPYGASLWSRWPEFGLHLANDGQLRHWRGDRDERSWPGLLRRGGEWPWTPETDPRTVTFARILEEVRRAGRRLSLRDLEMAMGGASRSTIDRAIKANQGQFDDVCGAVERVGPEPEEF